MERTNGLADTKESFNIGLRKGKRAEQLKARRERNFDTVQRGINMNNVNTEDAKKQIMNIFEWFRIQ